MHCVNTLVLPVTYKQRIHYMVAYLMRNHVTYMQRTRNVPLRNKVYVPFNYVNTLCIPGDVIAFKNVKQ